MTVKIYPSRLPGEPLETHQHRAMTVHEWMMANVKGYCDREDHPICVEIDGEDIAPAEWPLHYIKSETDVRIYPKVYGIELGVLAIISIVISVAAAAYSIIMMSKMDKAGAGSSTGDQLELAPAKANTARLGDPVREIFGRYRIFPDYLVQPVSRFDTDNPQIYRTSMLLCVGRGNFSISQGDIKIGNTPVSSFGDDVELTIYQPGADLSSDSRSENWYNSTEVGSTTSGTSGLDLASTGPSNVSVNADAIAISGQDITLIGSSTDDGDDDNDDGTDIPDSWKAGTVITAITPDTYTAAIESGRNVIYGDFTELNPSAGMAVSMQWGNYDYELFITSYDAGTPSVPGTGGNAASLTASAAPTTYDFSSSAVSFTITWAGSPHVISLSANYVTMSGLVEEISDQLTGTGLTAQSVDLKVQIIEPSSPYSGNSITTGILPSSVFGDSPVNVAGEASTGGSPGVYPSIKLAWNSATGTPFTGIPAGTQRLAIGAKGWQYRITEIDGTTISVERMVYNTEDVLVVDSSWPGFTARTLLDGSVTGVNDSYNWMGPFLSCPGTETTTQIELNFIYPNGLVDIGSKDGKIHWHDVELRVQYRLDGTTDWTEIAIIHGNDTVNMIGYTYVMNMPAAGNYEIRMRRETPVWGGTTRDSVQWQAMRSKLSARPTSYAGLTTIALTVRTGSRLAAQSDRRINLIANRLYDGSTSRSISGALRLVSDSLGLEVDDTAVSELESAYWTPDADRFDYATTDSISALDMLNLITNAGKSYFLFTDGMASVGREGVKSWSGVISPNEQVKALTTAFKAITDDDYDGVDVTYINSTTWAEETVQCRLTGIPTPLKTESFTLDGVVSQNKAYQIGMRRLMKYRLQRLNYTTTTNLEALCYNVGDRVVLVDDIPDQYQMISAWIESAVTASGVTTMVISEPVDWSKYDNPRFIVRYQDGTASQPLPVTRVNDFSFTTPYISGFASFDFASSSKEPPKGVFCDSSQAGYDGIISEIGPNSDGTCDVTALLYSEELYQYDSSTYPGNVE